VLMRHEAVVPQNGKFQISRGCKRYTNQCLVPNLTSSFQFSTDVCGSVAVWPLSTTPKTTEVHLASQTQNQPENVCSNLCPYHRTTASSDSQVTRKAVVSAHQPSVDGHSALCCSDSIITTVTQRPCHNRNSATFPHPTPPTSHSVRSRVAHRPREITTHVHSPLRSRPSQGAARGARGLVAAT
jgi:hypothetical protein